MGFQGLGCLKFFLPSTALPFGFVPLFGHGSFLIPKFLLSLRKLFFIVNAEIEQTLFPIAGHLFMTAFQLVMAFFGQGLKFGILLRMK